MFNEMDKGSIERVESLSGPPRPRERQRYHPANDEEKMLDRKVNLKLDFIVIPLLAIGFLVCSFTDMNYYHTLIPR
jgi:hypothetical protein